MKHNAESAVDSPMRLWTIHPACLDTKGLVAVWRESLLAQKVLAGETRGYTRHPQLLRFRDHAAPLSAIAAYLTEIAAEATRRGYRFNSSKISAPASADPIEETEGQLLYEWQHLQSKLQIRSPAHHLTCQQILRPQPHPLFRIVPGEIRLWEKEQTPRPVASALSR